jgi:hypothetical protein
MSSEHDSSSRGGSLEDIRVDDVEVDSTFQHALGQVRKRWKAIGATAAAAITAYAVYWVDVVTGDAGGLTPDVWVFGILTVALIIYTAVMLYGDIELD